jgi:hypothetical protein
MINQKLETYSHEELIQLEAGVHAAIQTFQKQSSEPYFEETQRLLIGLLVDVVNAQCKTLFPEGQKP